MMTARLYLHCLISRFKNEGNTQSLIRQWLRDGYDIRIVMPSPIMQHIIHKFGFEPAKEYIPAHYEDEVEVWRRRLLWTRSRTPRTPGLV